MKRLQEISVNIARAAAFCLPVVIFVFYTVYGCSGEKNTSNRENQTIAQITASADSKLIIGISKHYPNYSDWLLLADKNIVYYDFYTMPFDSAMALIGRCDGLLLSGGPDVEPSRFGKGWDTARCEIDFRRDTLEFALIDSARKLRMPILGICRGEQILNVYYGGSLIIDIPDDYKTTIQHKCKKSDTCFHDVEVIEGTLLQKLSGAKSGEINTNHHQAVDKLAKGFAVGSRSPDGIVESIEWAGGGAPPAGEPNIIAVQWHPERMNPKSPFSLSLAKCFLMWAKDYKNGKAKR